MSLAPADPIEVFRSRPRLRLRCRFLSRLRLRALLLASFSGDFAELLDLMPFAATPWLSEESVADPAAATIAPDGALAAEDGACCTERSVFVSIGRSGAARSFVDSATATSFSADGDLDLDREWRCEDRCRLLFFFSFFALLRWRLAERDRERCRRSFFALLLLWRLADVSPRPDRPRRTDRDLERERDRDREWRSDPSLDRDRERRRRRDFLRSSRDEDACFPLLRDASALALRLRLRPRRRLRLLLPPLSLVRRELPPITTTAVLSKQNGLH